VSKQKSKVVHKNRIFSVEEKPVKINGRTVHIFSVKRLNSVAILAISAKGRIILEKQYRPAVGNKVYEIPAGYIRKGEKPKVAAQRELKEETGYTALEMQEITYTYPSPGILNTKEYLFIAHDLRSGKTNFDKNENINIKEVSLKEALKLVKNRKIVDSKTLLAIFYYQYLIGCN
jgi:ADP-ribose pyrophosphatase